MEENIELLNGALFLPLPLMQRVVFEQKYVEYMAYQHVRPFVDVGQRRSRRCKRAKAKSGCVGALALLTFVCRRLSLTYDRLPLDT
jgi:hypothetical protein